MLSAQPISMQISQPAYAPVSSSAFVKDVHSVYFKSKSDQILGEGTLRLDKFILQLNEIKNVTVVIRGYADRAEEDPQGLSVKRIKSVETILSKSGILISNNIKIERQAFGATIH